MDQRRHGTWDHIAALNADSMLDLESAVIGAVTTIEMGMLTTGADRRWTVAGFRGANSSAFVESKLGIRWNTWCAETG